MKRLKEYIRKLDSFGVSYNFKYKSKEKYTTSFGGIVTLLFIGLAIFFGLRYKDKDIKTKLKLITLTNRLKNKKLR